MGGKRTSLEYYIISIDVKRVCCYHTVEWFRRCKKKKKGEKVEYWKKGRESRRRRSSRKCVKKLVVCDLELTTVGLGRAGHNLPLFELFDCEVEPGTE